MTSYILMAKTYTNFTKNANTDSTDSQAIWKLKIKHNYMHLQYSSCFGSLAHTTAFPWLLSLRMYFVTLNINMSFSEGVVIDMGKII